MPLGDKNNPHILTPPLILLKTLRKTAKIEILTRSTKIPPESAKTPAVLRHSGVREMPTITLPLNLMRDVSYLKIHPPGPQNPHSLNIVNLPIGAVPRRKKEAEP